MIFTLRSPHAGEGAAILKTVMKVLRSSDHLLTEADEFSYTVEQEDKLIQDHFDHPAKIMIVPECAGQIVGMLNFSVGGKRRISHMGDFGMSLLPEFRGIGIGKAMLMALLNWARANEKIEKVNLRVHSKNVSALQLYEKLGFREEGREVRGVKLAVGKYDDVICMSYFVD
jgi:RimJ/RimL family protein N-acetyltransferase